MIDIIKEKRCQYQILYCILRRTTLFRAHTGSAQPLVLTEMQVEGSIEPGIKINTVNKQRVQLFHSDSGGSSWVNLRFAAQKGKPSQGCQGAITVCN